MKPSTRKFFESFTRRACEAIAKRLPPPRVIYDRDGVSPYLTRHYLIGCAKMPDGSAPFDALGNPKQGAVFDERFPVQLYLHRFHRGDQDEELHNHPWRWSASFVLAGGYLEERRTRDRHGRPSNGVEVRAVLPFMVNRIGGDDFHRVDLLEKDAWTLFLVGPRVSSWGFWNRHSGVFTPWRDFLAQRRR